MLAVVAFPFQSTHLLRFSHNLRVVHVQPDANPAPKRARRGDENKGNALDEADDWVHEAHGLLKRCQSHQKGFYFKEPVDPVALDILDYFEIISDPMDFSTVGKKITHDEYSRKVFCVKSASCKTGMCADACRQLLFTESFR